MNPNSLRESVLRGRARRSTAMTLCRSLDRWQRGESPAESQLHALLTVGCILLFDKIYVETADPRTPPTAEITVR